MDRACRYKMTESVVFARVCGYPVLAVTRDQYEETEVAACLLNETGEYIWKQIELGFDVEQIIRVTAEYFEEDPDVIRPEVEDFLHSLEAQRMVRRVDRYRNHSL